MTAAATDMFADKKLLITGGTGSFGHAALERFLHAGASEVRIFSRDEKKQEDMRIRLNNPRLRFYIGDVRNYEGLADAMAGVNYVFHAAALKQVPSCEFFPLEALRTNVLGADNALNAAVSCGVDRMVVLSTDKAVYPINAMGLTKALMEKVMVAKSRIRSPGETILCGTRYGNVMASRGSVIPLFVRQIKSGQPLTITDPAMTRFLMSLEDSVELVLHAFTHGNQGDIFVQKAPAATVGVIAQALQQIMGSNNPVRTIGTRHGEKLYETLVAREELAKAEETDRYYRIPADDRDLNYSKYFVEGDPKVAYADDYTSHNTERLDVDQVKSLLLRLPYIQAQLHA